MPSAEGPGGRGERQLAAATAAEEPHADPPQGWGPYRESIEELVASCADHLGRLQRSLTGEVSTEPLYFHEKAALLQDTATRLAQRAQDVVRWLGECDAAITTGQAGESIIDHCTLPSDHAGPHRPDGHNTPAAMATQRARDLAGRTTRVSRRLGHLSTDIDHRQPEHDADISGQRLDIQELTAEVDQLGHNTRILATVLRATDHNPAIDQQLAERHAVGPDTPGL